MKTLGDYTHQKQSTLFKKYGTFFAFGDEQFRRERKKDVQYVNAGIGMFCPKENIEKLIEGLKKISINGILEDIRENGKTSIIKRELANHEYGYTGEIEQTVEALGDYPITIEQIKEVASKL